MFVRVLRLCPPVLGKYSLSKAPYFRFSTFNIQVERQKALDLMQSIQAKEGVAELDFSMYEEGELFDQLQTMQANKQLHTSLLTQSLNYLHEDRYIHPVLYMLYDRLNSLSDVGITFVFRKILAYKPQKLPEVPQVRTIENNEMLLFLLSQLYPPRKLVEWIENIPFWQDNNGSLTILAMIVFNIYDKMTKSERELHSEKLDKCLEVIESALKGAEFGDDALSVLILAFQLHNPFAEKLLKEKGLCMSDIGPEQLCLLMSTMSQYRHSGPRSAEFDGTLQDIVQEVIQLDWQKLGVFSLIGFWKTLLSLPKIKGVWIKFLTKLVSHTMSMQTKSQSSDLSTSDLILILQAMQKHYVNKKQLLHMLLVRLQPHLLTLSTQQLLRLVKSLAIYVKQQEDYFKHLRSVCDQKRLQFTASEVKELRTIYARFNILFRRPF